MHVIYKIISFNKGENAKHFLCCQKYVHSNNILYNLTFKLIFNIIKCIILYHRNKNYKLIYITQKDLKMKIKKNINNKKI